MTSSEDFYVAKTTESAVAEELKKEPESNKNILITLKKEQDKAKNSRKNKIQEAEKLMKEQEAEKLKNEKEAKILDQVFQLYRPFHLLS